MPYTSGGSKALARQRERMSALESKREAAINQSDEPVLNDEVADEQERLELRRLINKRERKISVLDRRIQLGRMTEKYGGAYRLGRPPRTPEAVPGRGSASAARDRTIPCTAR